jgi:hypothetical protein
MRAQVCHSSKQWSGLLYKFTGCRLDNYFDTQQANYVWKVRCEGQGDLVKCKENSIAQNSIAWRVTEYCVVPCCTAVFVRVLLWCCCSSGDRRTCCDRPQWYATSHCVQPSCCIKPMHSYTWPYHSMLLLPGDLATCVGHTVPTLYRGKAQRRVLTRGLQCVCGCAAAGAAACSWQASPCRCRPAAHL